MHGRECTHHPNRPMTTFAVKGKQSLTLNVCAPSTGSAVKLFMLPLGRDDSAHRQFRFLGHWALYRFIAMSGTSLFVSPMASASRRFVQLLSMIGNVAPAPAFW